MKEQNLNIGDELICKRIFHPNFEYYILNSCYTVYDIKFFNIDNKFFNIDNAYYYMTIGNEKMNIVCSYEDIYTYFYTKNETRKIKLQKLHEESKF